MTSGPRPIEPDYAVIYPDGVLVYGYCQTENRDIREEVRPLLAVRTLRGDSCGPIVVWCADNFTADLPPNPLAQIATQQAAGYQHPNGWRGPIAISMREDASDHTPALSPEVVQILGELRTPQDEDRTP